MILKNCLKINFITLKTNLEELYVKIPLDGALIVSSKEKLQKFESVFDITCEFYICIFI